MRTLPSLTPSSPSNGWSLTHDLVPLEEFSKYLAYLLKEGRNRIITVGLRGGIENNTDVGIIQI